MEKGLERVDFHGLKFTKNFLCVYEKLTEHKDDILMMPLRDVYDYIAKKCGLKAYLVSKHVILMRKHEMLSFKTFRHSDNKSIIVQEVHFADPKYWIR